ncbi:ubiquitin-conjugating enzyme domain-containing protein [Phthorimaea operculella]|nr:ubiquitin-conjugating enzyme domain-containing protein [Phthorimaea operculella]
MVCSLWRKDRSPGTAYDLQATLLRQAAPMLQVLSPRHTHHALQLFDTVAHLSASWVRETCSARGESGSEARLSGLLADSASSPNVPSSSEQSQTDESKAAGSASVPQDSTNVEDERKQSMTRAPCVADAVLQRHDLMQRFYTTLALTDNINTLLLNSARVLQESTSVKNERKQSMTRASCVADAVLQRHDLMQRFYTTLALTDNINTLLLNSARVLQESTSVKNERKQSMTRAPCVADAVLQRHDLMQRFYTTLALTDNINTLLLNSARVLQDSNNVEDERKQSMTRAPCVADAVLQRHDLMQRFYTTLALTDNINTLLLNSARDSTNVEDERKQSMTRAPCVADAVLQRHDLMQRFYTTLALTDNINTLLLNSADAVLQRHDLMQRFYTTLALTDNINTLLLNSEDERKQSMTRAPCVADAVLQRHDLMQRFYTTLALTDNINTLLLNSDSTNVEDERKQSMTRAPCVADAVLQRHDLMQRFYTTLALTDNINTLLLNSGMSSEPAAEYSSLKEEVFWLVAHMASVASSPALMVPSLMAFLRKEEIVHLSQALQQLIIRLLDKPEALNVFIEAGGLELAVEKLTACHQAGPSNSSGLVSSLMNYLKLPPQLMNLSTPAGKKTQPPNIDTNSGLVNIAPLCTVTCGNPTAQAADVLLDGGGGSMTPSGACAARRVRAAAWSYHFFSADDASLALTLTLPYAVQLHEVQLQPHLTSLATWSYHFFSADDASLALTLTLPYAVQLHEVQLQPHLTSLATCPGAVAIEAGCGGTLAPLGPPQNTAGMTFIRLAISRPIVCTTVQIRLYKPRDSSNMGLLQLRLLAQPAFHNQPSTVNTNNWAHVVAACTRTGVAASRWQAVAGAGAVAALCACVASGGSAAPHAHHALLHAARATPRLRGPLITTLLHMDEQAHAHAFQVSSGGRLNSSMSSVCSLVRALCVSRGSEGTLHAYLQWLTEAAALCTREQQLPSAALVHTLAEVLWTLKEERLMDNLEELITDDLFELVYNWIKEVPENGLLKKSLDAVLCSMCYIRPELFKMLLEHMGVPYNQDESMEGLTDDTKVHSTYIPAAARAPPPPCRHQPPARCGARLPHAVTHAIAEYSEAKLALIKEQMGGSQEDVQMSDASKESSESKTELPPMKTICNLVEWTTSLCMDRSMTDWLGGPGSVFWSPLLRLLCYPRPPESTWQEGAQYAQLEESTIRLFAQLTVCHAANQKLFAATLHSILESLHCVANSSQLEESTIRLFAQLTVCHAANQKLFAATLHSILESLHCVANQKLFAATLHSILESLHCVGGVGISGFTRALILRLVLSGPRATVALRWAGCTGGGSGGGGGHAVLAPRHPATRCHALLHLPLHTTVRHLLTTHRPPIPLLDDTTKLCMNNSSNSGTASVLRSASDTAIMTVAEAWELSLAAASASKDKRVKDVKNTSLKQQNSKKRQSKTNNETSMLSVADDLIETTVRVQVAGLEGFVPASTKLSQLTAAAPHQFGPHLTLTLHLNTNGDVWSGPTWEPPPNSDSTSGGGPHHHDLDWVKLDDPYEEVVELGVSSANSTEESGCLGVPAHALVALGLLLKLPGYADALLDEGARAVHLLRLLLGVTHDEDGRSIVVGSGGSNGNWSLGTLPFRVVGALLEAAPLRSEAGRNLRQALLQLGAVRLVLACLAVFTHHRPASNDLEAAPLRSEAGRNLRQALLQLGAVRLVLACLAVFTHHRPASNDLEAAPLRREAGRNLRQALLQLGAVRLVLACLAVFTHHRPASNDSSQTSNGAGKSEDKSQLYWAKGTGFGTGSTQQSWNVEQALVRQRTEEEHVTVLLQVLASFMNPGEKWPPEESTETEGEQTETENEVENNELPAEFVDMLAGSSLVPAICSYLRNDSVLDMSRHIPLYVCVLKCARALSRVGGTRLQASLRPLPRLLAQMSRTTNSYATKLRMSKKNIFGKMTYSQRFSTSSNSELSEEDEGLASLIADIQATSALLCRDTDQQEASSGPARPLSGANREQRYIELMRSMQFETFEMIVECGESAGGAGGFKFTVPYHFEGTVRAAGERSHPARMKRLAQEAATLATSLPLSYSSSVFVRTDTDRLDVMKVLITGPSDTPYANGCFILDVYFPAEYPLVPMLINLETTGRQSVRFNPNLYNDGKVCLSVLNTWHGRPEEKWNAHTSSFLQVLVSIQSLILVPEPYFNEPGYERSRGTRVGSSASLEYNSNIYQACVRWAMLDHLRNPEPCFKEVIQTHFWIKRNEIMQTVGNWITELEGQNGDERTQRSIQLNLMALKRHYVKLQEELAKLPCPPGLEDLDEPTTSTTTWRKSSRRSSTDCWPSPEHSSLASGDPARRPAAGGAPGTAPEPCGAPTLDESTSNAFCEHWKSLRIA